VPALPPVPTDGRAAVEDWVATHLGDVVLEGPEGVRGSPAFIGGQDAADAALDALDIRGYAGRRSEVWPVDRRGASRLSPYIRHGLLTLPEVWAAVAGAPARDRGKFRDELLWQEYARHVYARVGPSTGRPLRHVPIGPAAPWPDPWPAEMACMALVVDELETDGWLVNQTRMWMASQWTVRGGAPWRAGEDRFFRHLLDGSRAANRLGWQWTVGAGTGRPYGFARWQVEKRAPGLCAGCALRHRCPIQEFPDAPTGPAVEPPARLSKDPDPARTGGPEAAASSRGSADAPPAAAGDRHVFGGAPAPGDGLARGDGTGGGGQLALGDGLAPFGGSAAGGAAAPDAGPPATASAVWLTAESLGVRDPALLARPDLPAVFVFDHPRLARWRLSSKRLVFLAETLGELARTRPMELHVGDPADVLTGRALAATWTPVPGWQRLAAELRPVETHPWPWLARPHGRSARSFSSWRKGLPADRQRGA